MPGLRCEATDCTHNKDFRCYCGNIKMSARRAGASCNSFEGVNNSTFRNDSEFARALDAGISCSAESCAFNIHFTCRAAGIEVDKNAKACKTYYGI